jgi:hypothetical protein
VKHFCFLALLSLNAAPAAEITLPDSCGDQICVTDLRWKKGTVEHTLTGFIAPKQGNIESVEIVFAYSDPKHHGDIRLRLKNVQSKTPFYFKLAGGGLLTTGKFDWNQSSVRVEATAIVSIAGQEKDGISCSFHSFGSRLQASIKNASNKDAVLDYGLLSLISGGESLRLNGTHGKYTDLGTPNPSTLIPSGTSITEEFIPFGSATFADGAWVEDWKMHYVLSRSGAALALPLTVGGKQTIEKIPLEVVLGNVASEGKVTKP